VATYDLQPEMSAYGVRDAVIAELEKQKHDFICLNFANGDMVGHTGYTKPFRRLSGLLTNAPVMWQRLHAPTVMR
jgi:hypothetical protein